MKAPSTILALLCVLGLGIAGLFLLGPVDSTDQAQAPETEVLSGTSALPSRTLGGPRPPLEAGAQSAGRSSAPDVGDAQEASVTLRGRVTLSDTCGDDPDLRVYAVREPTRVNTLIAAVHRWDPESTEEVVAASAPVAPDGNFELPLAEGGEAVHVMLLGRVLYTEHSLEVKPDDTSRPLLLSPRCGAAVVGSLSVGLGEEPVELGEAKLSTAPATGGDSRNRFGGRSRRRVRSRADGSFTVPAISTRGSQRLTVDHEGFAPQRIEIGALEPGTVHEVTIELTTGASLAGRVVDGAGNGIEGAQVQTVADVEIGSSGYGMRMAESGADGAFSIEGVAPGPQALQASKPGYLEGRKFLTVAEGQVETSLVLVLDEGNSVSGRVAWPDGTPAPGVSVDARFDPSQLYGSGGLNAASGGKGEVESDEQGLFRISGLGVGPFELRASTPPPEELRDALLAETGADLADAPWSARLDHIAPGSEDLQLVLHAPLGIGGRVVDEDNQPVTAFDIRAIKTLESPMGPVEQEREQHSFTDEEGSFFLVGLERGDWMFHAIAEGYAGSEGVSVSLGDAPPEALLIRLVHAGTVAGRVYTPEGVPVSDAAVFVGAEGPSWQRQVSGSPELPSATTEDDGSFLLEGVLPGQVEVLARAEGYATSVSALLELAPRQQIDDVELFLTMGGTLTGEVIADDERPSVNATIQVVHMGEFEIHFTTTDSEGRFRLENLDPGDHQVNAMPKASRMIEMADGESDSLGKLVAELKTAMVEITDGELTHVVLGTPAQDPVVVSGRITLDGEPHARAFVSFFREGGLDLSKTRPATSDEDGRYSITVDGAGSYLVLVQQMDGDLGSQSSVEFSLEIPEGQSCTRDLELPLGRLSGLVRGAEGDPAAGERVTLLPGGASQTGLFWGGRFHGEVSTDDEGRFDIRGLAPGEYMLSVGGMTAGGLFGGESAHGRQVREIRVNEGQWIRDIEFLLERPGSIEATVTDTAGNTIEGAAIFVRNDEGRPVDVFSTLSTDGRGRGTYRGLQPGVYTVSARQTSGFASQETDPVRVETGQTVKVTLTVEEGTRLIVQLVDGDRQPLRGSVSVIDARGREVGNMFGLADILAMMKEGGGGMAANVHRTGPLAPGRYRVTASGPDGRQISKPINLKNRPERKVTLRFKD
ncbi:MAG TPA: carboxypeptidase-like regulatory domain-containing protein [Planctomycetota bacterium]|nr:carboxypeptidase-like regulatory domain-containing protein [Planctomycetota bacterium]